MLHTDVYNLPLTIDLQQGDTLESVGCLLSLPSPVFLHDALRSPPVFLHDALRSQLALVSPHIQVPLHSGLVPSPFPERDTIDEHLLDLRGTSAHRFGHDKVREDSTP